MGLFRRRKTVDLTEGPSTGSPDAGGAGHESAVHVGVPGRCPTCHGFGYIDKIDMRHRFQRQHCRECGHVWEFSFDEEGAVLDVTDIEIGSLDQAAPNQIV